MLERALADDRTRLVVATGTLDLTRQVFRGRDGRRVRLSGREAELLAFLAARAPAAVDRDELLVRVWGHHKLSLSRAIDTTVARVRKKIEGSPASAHVLVTVHGHGYRLVLGEAPAPAPLPKAAPSRAPLELGDARVDLLTGMVQRPEGCVALTARERFALDRLLQEGGGWVSRQRIARMLGLSGRPDTITTVIYRLRQKLERDPAAPRFIESQRGSGYRLRVDDAPAVTTPDTRLDALRALTDYVGGLLDYGDCVVYVRRGEALVQTAAYGPKRAPDGSVRAPRTQRLDQGIVGACATLADSVLVADTADDPRYLRDLHPARSELAVPIIVRDRVVGVLDSESPTPHRYSARDEIVFVSLAVIAAAAFTSHGSAP